MSRSRILLHDYSGHPFQVELSRALARRGHRVRHLHCGDYTSGKGDLCLRETDPEGLDIRELTLGRRVDKYAASKRFLHEWTYGMALRKALETYRPEVVISSNAPLIAQALMLHWCRANRVRFIFWQQDIYSAGMIMGARRRFGLLGVMLAAPFRWLERAMLRASDQVVVIAEEFSRVVEAWGVNCDHIHVVENWAPLDELPLRPRHNDWSLKHALGRRRVLMYAGTLGMKHNPDMLLAAAEAMSAEEDAVVVVVSEGIGADYIRTEAARRHLENVVLLPFQDWQDLPCMIASADVLAVLLEPAAGVFSVPSKLLTYHCAGRAVVAAVPTENLASKTVAKAGSGVCVDPKDPEAFSAAVMSLLRDDRLRLRYGAAARAYAEQTFDIETVTSRFERILGISSSARGTAASLATLHVGDLT